MRELRVPRVEVSPGSNSLAWSNDGELAIAGVSSVTIFVPKLGPEISFHRTATLPVEQWPSTEFVNEMPSIYGSGAQTFVSEICWSPSGMSETRGCLLAALSSAGDAYIFSNSHGVMEAKWVLKYHASQFVSDPIHSIAWSVDENNNWGQCQLAVGCAGAVHFITFKDGQAFYGSKIVLPNLGFIVSMKWSNRGLAVSDDSNCVVLLQPSSNTMASEPLLPASRFRICGLAWLDDALVVAQTGKVTVINGTKKAKFSLQFNAISSVLAVGNSWAVYGSHGEHFGQGETLQLAALKSGNFVTFYGAAVHPNQRVVAFLHSSHNDVSVRYPLPSSERARIAFQPLDSAEQVLYPSQKGSPLIEWWALEQLKPVMKFAYTRPTFSGGLPGALESLLFSSEIDMARYKLRFGDKVMEAEIRRVLAETVVNAFQTPESRQNLLDIDRAVLLSMANFCVPPIKLQGVLASPIDIMGDFFTETFDFAEAKDPSSIQSIGGRRWRRCSVTLLPLLTQTTMESDGGDYTKLDTTWFPENSAIARVLAEQTQVCVFTAARWHYRRQSS